MSPSTGGHALWALLSAIAISLFGCGDDEASPTGSGGAGAVGGTGAAPAGGAGGAGEGGAAGGGGLGGEGGAAPVGVPYAFVGLSSGEVLVHDLDLDTGALSLLHTVDAGANPSFLAVAPDRRFLYAVNEGSSEVASFEIDAPTAALTFLNRVAAGGQGPTHIAVDATGGWVMTANYGGGSMSIFQVAADGSLGEASVTPTGSQAHWVGTDAQNQYLFVVNKGTDAVSQLTFDATTGSIAPNTPAEVATEGGAGPRHLAFHPNAPFAYVINELDDTMTAYAFDAVAGTLEPIQTLSTLPGGTGGGGNTCAELAFTPDGAFLYGSNRGHDSIVAYSVDPATGLMTLVGHEGTDIDTPRSFAVDPTGRVLLVANQGGDSVASFAIDPATGALTHLVTTSMPASPPFVGIFDLPSRR